MLRLRRSLLILLAVLLPVVVYGQPPRPGTMLPASQVSVAGLPSADLQSAINNGELGGPGGTGDISAVGDCPAGACFTGVAGAGTGTVLRSATDLYLDVDDVNSADREFQVRNGADVPMLKVTEGASPPNALFTFGNNTTVIPRLIVNGQGELRLIESQAGGGVNYTEFRANGLQNANFTCTMQQADGHIPDACVGDGTDAGSAGGDNITIQTPSLDVTNPQFNDSTTINVTGATGSPNTVTWDVNSAS